MANIRPVQTLGPVHAAIAPDAPGPGIGPSEERGPDEAQADAGEHPTAVAVQPDLETAPVRPVVEGAVRAAVAGERLVEVVRAVRVCRAVVLLRVVALPGQVPVAEAGGNLVAGDRQGG